MQRFGFEHSFPVTGQTYPRKVDAQVVCTLAGIAASVHRFCNDVRLLAGLKQIEEPFEENQVGSTAMAYKRNPMRCERATGLARFVISLSTSPLQTAAEQWLERTLDDSANKRLAVPEPFLAIDGCVNIVINVARGMVVYPQTITAAVMAELPFMATEEILMAGVAAGGDRQELHERIRRHSLEAGQAVKTFGRPNDLLARLGADPAFSKATLADAVIPSRFIGRAPAAGRSLHFGGRRAHPKALFGPARAVERTDGLTRLDNLGRNIQFLPFANPNIAHIQHSSFSCGGPSMGAAMVASKHLIINDLCESDSSLGEDAAAVGLPGRPSRSEFKPDLGRTRVYFPLDTVRSGEIT